MRAVRPGAAAAMICIVLVGVVGCGGRTVRPAATQPPDSAPAGVLAPAQQATEAADAINATTDEKEEQVEGLADE